MTVAKAFQLWRRAMSAGYDVPIGRIRVAWTPGPRIDDDDASSLKRREIDVAAFRRRKRERSAVSRVDAGVVADPSLSVDASSDVSAAIDRLPERLRVAVICRYFLDLSEADMAAVLRVRPGTVKSRLHEARALLAKDPGLVVTA